MGLHAYAYVENHDGRACRKTMTYQQEASRLFFLAGFHAELRRIPVDGVSCVTPSAVVASATDLGVSALSPFFCVLLCHRASPVFVPRGLPCP